MAQFDKGVVFHQNQTHQSGMKFQTDGAHCFEYSVASILRKQKMNENKKRYISFRLINSRSSPAM